MTRTPFSDALDPESTALIVVDAQVAFASPESPLAEAGRDLSAAIEAVPQLRRLLAAAREGGLTVAFTRAIRTEDGQRATESAYDVLPDAARTDDPICLEGSPEAEYVAGVEPTDAEYEVTKLRPNAFHDTPLEFYLRAEDVDTVVIGGFATNVCVEGTARGAHERGFDVVLLEDCCAAFSREAHEATLRNVNRFLGATATLPAVTEHLQSTEAT